MIYVYWGLGILAALILIVQIGGMMMPVGHTATISRTLAASPEQVWAVIIDVENHPKWRKELQSVTVKSTEPLDWIEKSKYGEMPLRAEVFDPPTKLVAKIDGSKLPFGGNWTFELVPEGEGTKLTITENGEVYAPMFRFLGWVTNCHDKTIKTYLGQLEPHLMSEAN